MPQWTCIYFGNQFLFNMGQDFVTLAGDRTETNICAAMFYAVNCIYHLNVIDLKFMKKDHSYLEADSMHATIERNAKECDVLVRPAWIHPNHICS